MAREEHTGPKSRGGVSRRRTQAERSAESEERMLNAAEILFAQQGMLRTTLVEIGNGAGYSGGLATHRFGSKLGILEALIDRYRESVHVKYVDRNDDGSDRPITLDELLDRYFDIQTEEVPRRRALHVLMGESLGPLHEGAALFVNYNRWFEDVIESSIVESQRRGLVLADVKASDLAMAVIATLRGAMLLWHSDPTRFTLVALGKNVRRHLQWAMTVDKKGKPRARKSA